MRTLFTKQQIASLSNACSGIYDPKEELLKKLAINGKKQRADKESCSDIKG